ncbi:MAG: hypothetical protein GY749_31310 [Desulfobacteraceae bacterium]|nr:hypothetical protein [Desulfobacteraceae bacterium]
MKINFKYFVCFFFTLSLIGLNLSCSYHPNPSTDTGTEVGGQVIDGDIHAPEQKRFQKWYPVQFRELQEGRIEPIIRFENNTVFFENDSGVPGVADGYEENRYVIRSLASDVSIGMGEHIFKGEMSYNGNYKRLYIIFETLDNNEKSVENYKYEFPKTERSGSYNEKITFPFKVTKGFSKARFVIVMECYGKVWGHLKSPKLF